MSEESTGQIGVVYLLHFEDRINPAHPCQHYIGWAADLGPRINAHRNGTGARLTQVAAERGIGFKVARVWPDADRHFERKLKNRKEAPRLCPICNGQAVAAIHLDTVDELEF